jgi:hypothetical protein
MLFMEIIVVYCKHHKKQLNTLCEQNVMLKEVVSIFTTVF